MIHLEWSFVFGARQRSSFIQTDFFKWAFELCGWLRDLRTQPEFLAKSTSFCPSGKRLCGPRFPGPGVRAENWRRGSPLGLSRTKEADLERVWFSTLVGFPRLHKPLQVRVFYIKTAVFYSCRPTVHSQCQRSSPDRDHGLTRALSSEPIVSTAAQVLRVHPSAPTFLALYHAELSPATR